MKDYYKILEVEEKASPEEIKKSFRTLSKKYHPDRNPNGDEKFKEIAEAYEVLGNKDKRQKYDNSKNNPFQGTNFEDFFSSMFNGQNNGHPQQRRNTVPDKVVKLQITPIESYKGATKSIQYMKENHCPVCSGSGGEQKICGTCNGAGFQIRTLGTGFMVQHVRTVCNGCGGQGYTLVNRCYHCDGRGTKSSVNNVDIKLPVGSDSGQFLKLEKYGDFKNGDYGNLIIQIELLNKDGFEKINNDLVYNLFLDLEALKRDKYSIPHPDGELNIDSPRIFDTSKPLRLRGKGYQGGDMYVKLNVKFERPI